MTRTSRHLLCRTREVSFRADEDPSREGSLSTIISNPFDRVEIASTNLEWTEGINTHLSRAIPCWAACLGDSSGKFTTAHHSPARQEVEMTHRDKVLAPHEYLLELS